jgi:hypothetical protein
VKSVRRVGGRDVSRGPRGIVAESEGVEERLRGVDNVGRVYNAWRF